MTDTYRTNREHWTSRVGFILAAAGSAIGLGNIWRFPYVTGENGGAIFLIVYLAMIFFIGYPLFINEMAIGKLSQKDPVGAFRALSPNTPWWLAGALGVFTGFVILSYYSVVAGWSLAYTWRALFSGFSQASDFSAEFQTHIASTPQLLLWHGIFMLLCMGIIAVGIKRGIERWSEILMPILFLLIIALIIRSITLNGAWEGVRYFLNPDISRLTPRMLLNAVAQAFFTLSIGMGAIITYGSYLSKNDEIPANAAWVVGMDTTIAVLSGFMIFPAVFAFGLSPESGAGLTFMTLPNVFAMMPFGRFFGFAFFLLLSIAALTSAISLLETVTAYLVDEKGVSRHRAVLILGTAIFFLGVPPILGYGVWSNWKFLGKFDILDTYDTLANSLLLPVGALAATIFTGYTWKTRNAAAEINRTARHIRVGVWWSILMRYVIPCVIAVIIITGLIDTFRHAS